MNEREKGINYFLLKTAKKYNDYEIEKMKYNCNDRGNEDFSIKEYSMCYNKNIPQLENFCGPDWVFYHWPSANILSFEETKNEIIKKSYKTPTINKIGWYGNIYSGCAYRPVLHQYGQNYPEIFDIFHVYPVNGGINEKCSNYLSLIDLMKYKFLIDIEGNGYSGRLKWLLFSRRPIFLIDRTYIEYFYNDLIPYKHFIPVKMDLSDLLEKVEWAQMHYDEAIQIAENAFEFAKENFTEDKLLDRVYYVYKNMIEYHNMNKSSPEIFDWEIDSNTNTPCSIEIVVARYNEDLVWLKFPPFNKYPVVIYNKGPNEDFYKPPLLKKVVNLPNVGRESHTFLWHIIDNYHGGISPLTAFLTGSTELEKKYRSSVHMVEMLEQTQNTFLSCGYCENANDHMWNFQIDKCPSSHAKNIEANMDDTIRISKIRPFGKWFSATFINGEKNAGIAWNSIIGISNRHILQKPIEFYERLIRECNTHHNEETGHYFERSWYAVFYPYT